AEGPALWTLDGRELWAPGAALDAQALAEAALTPRAPDAQTLERLRAASRGILVGLDLPGPAEGGCDVAATLDALADDARVLRVLGALWTRGGWIDVGRRCGDRPLRRVGLPVYSFERTRHWVDIPAEAKPSNYDVAL
ncbi:hypothetical protein ACTZWW_22425, partial [Salinarimonas sp. NSM]|uniref:hypothetical protein n=1 Tax=Salinarimonas sp. NSM TaxID=3458003 RepID=UPI0040375706